MSSDAIPGNSFVDNLHLDSKFKPISGLCPFTYTIIFIILLINYLPVHNYYGFNIAGYNNSILALLFSNKLHIDEYINYIYYYLFKNVSLNVKNTLLIIISYINSLNGLPFVYEIY